MCSICGTVKGWPGLRFSTEITVLEEKKGCVGKQRKGKEREVMREEGHLVVICVYGQTPFPNILDVTSQPRENVDDH